MKFLPNDRSVTRDSAGHYVQVTEIPRSKGDVGYPNPAVTEYVSHYRYPWTDVRTGKKFPDWRKYVRAGTDATTPYNRSFAYVKKIGGSASLNWVYPSNPPALAHTEVWGQGSVTIPGTASTEGFIKADNQALVRLYKAISEEYRQFQALVFLGELGESVRMLRKPFSGMQRTIETYLTRVQKRGVSIKNAQKRAILGRDKKGRPIYRSSNLKEIEQMLHATWLEASFGMRPLLADTADIAVTIARLSDSIRRGRVKGFGSSPGAVYVSGTYQSSYGDIAGYYNYRDTSSWKVVYRAGLHNALNAPDSLSRLRQLAGFTPNEFVPTAYELLPWSFLADYFFNTGECLSSYWTCTSYVAWANQTTIGENYRQMREHVDHRLMQIGKGSTYRGSTGALLPGSYDAVRLSVGRNVIDVANMPQPLIDSKRFSDWNPLKVANVVALLRSKTKVASTLLTASRGR